MNPELAGVPRVSGLLQYKGFCLSQQFIGNQNLLRQMVRRTTPSIRVAHSTIVQKSAWGTHSASLSCSSLCHYASLVRAVCVNAHVRICAGAISDDRPCCDSRGFVRRLLLLNAPAGRFADPLQTTDLS